MYKKKATKPLSMHKACVRTCTLNYLMLQLTSDIKVDFDVW